MKFVLAQMMNKYLKEGKKERYEHTKNIRENFVYMQWWLPNSIRSRWANGKNCHCSQQNMSSEEKSI